MKRVLCLATLLAALALVAVGAARAETFIVQEGRPNAEIVVAENPPRMVKLAADELRTYVSRITGAELAIVTAPTGGAPVKVYVGRSPHTDELGLTDEGLKYGAFRMVSGPGYLVLLGRDFDFEPREPWAPSHGDRQRALDEWDRLTAERTDAAWGNPMLSLWRFYNRDTETWAHDEGGSLNAVYAFLRSLGVRWYMPGELGEVVPTMESIPLPDLDRTVRPDYALRQFIGPAYMNAPPYAVLWGRRMGLNYGYELLGAGAKTHGMANVHAREEMQRKHPEYYALIGDRRDTFTRGTGHACWSSEGLLREAANYARAVFDIYDEPTLQLSPQDGLRMCRCEGCAGLSPSDAVWGFLDRVARQVRETHPDRLLIGAAYGSYRPLPESVAKLSPNIAVRINNVGRATLDDPERWEWYWSLVQGWREKAASGKIVRVENNYMDTVLHPRLIAKDLRAMKGISLGEMNEVTRESAARGRGQTWGRPGTNHLNLYVNARFLWDADQDLDALLDEYYDLFYGPASAEMKTAFEYAEQSYSREHSRGRLELPQRVRLLELLHEARQAAGETVYGERVQFIIEEFDPLESLRDTLNTSRERDDSAEFRYWDLSNRKWDDDKAAARIDGRLDEAFWSLSGRLRDAATGDAPALNTRFHILLDSDALWVGVHCEEEGAALSVPTEDNGDPAILDGDRIEILIETDIHAYYRIVVNPAGALLDMAEGNGEGARWASNAEVATHRGDGYWSLEARIPVVPEEEGAMDPFHHIVYRRRPSSMWPWHFNIARARVRGEETQVSAFSFGEDGDFLDRMFFGKLYR